MLWILLVLLVCRKDTPHLPEPPECPRVLKRQSRTRISTVNCRTLLDDSRLDELDSALSNKHIDICALQEIRRNGFYTTNTSNYCIYTFGECSGHRGVGFAVHKKFSHLIEAVRGVPETDGRIILLEILLSDNKQSTTLVCGYAPPNNSPAATREKFYAQLAKVATAKTLLLGDFNARVGRRLAPEDTLYGSFLASTVGPYSLKNDITPNSNGSLLLDIASKNNLRHVASHFRAKDSKRWTWRHPRYQTRSVLDHVLVPASHMRFLSRCFVPSDFELSSDHRPVICELNFRPKTMSRAKVPPQLDIHMLNCDSELSKSYSESVSSILSNNDPDTLDSEELAAKTRSAMLASAEKVIPPKPKNKFPSEFTENTISLIRSKSKLWKDMQKSGVRVTRSIRANYKEVCNQTKRAISADRNAKLEQEAAQLNTAFRENTFKGYSLLRKQFRTRSKAVLPPESDFTEHYRSHYELGPESPIVVHGCELPCSITDDSLTREDFDKGVQKLNSNRSSGHDNIAPEFIKHGGTVLLQWIFILMQRIWTFVCDLPSADRLGSLLPIPKKAGGTLVSCFRPICLLTSIYKLYAILVFQKVKERVKDFVTWTQAGFISGRSCGNNLWLLRRVAERAIEFNTPVYCLLVDYKGAFDALNRTTLGRVLALFLSPSMVRRIMSLYINAKANVRISDITGPEFDLQRGVRQGCPASPSFFTVALAYVSWSFRTIFAGVQLVSLYLASIEYADDQILLTLNPAEIQDMITFLAETALPFGLRLAPQKCELICFHRPGTVDKSLLPRVVLGDQVIPWKSSVVYLGSRFAEHGNSLSAIKHRICCAESVVTRLNNRVFKRRAITGKTKGLFVSTAVLASLLYGLQYCCISKRDQRCLDGYYLRLVKRILHLPHNFHLSYEEAEQRTDVERPSFRLRRERLRWTGHVLRSEDVALTEVLTFTPEGGARGRGRPRLRYYDTVKMDLGARGIIITARNQQQFWNILAARAENRATWQEDIVN